MEVTATGPDKPGSAGRSRRLRFEARDAIFVGLAALICAPMIIVAAGLFGPSGEQWRHIRSTLLLDYVIDTVVLGAGVTVGAVVIGTVLAWFTVNYEFPGSRIFTWALGLPIALPAYISAYTYAHITGITGPVSKVLGAVFGREAASAMMIDMMSLPGCIFVMVFALYPYVYFIARSFFSGSSRSYIETARSCGRDDFSVFLRVAVPIARPAIIAGGALVLMETINEYGATSYYGVNTMVTGIFRAWFSLGDVASAVKLAGYFLIAVIGVLSIERITRSRRRYGDAHPRPVETVRPGRAARIAMFVLSLIPLGFGLLIPVTQLLWWTVGSVSLPRLAELSWTLARSAVLAGVGGSACLLVSFVTVYLVRRERTFVTTVATEAVLSGYAIPGVIIVVGVLALSRFLNELSGVYLFGSLGLLVYSYVVRYLAITSKPLQTASAKIPESFDDAATLGGHRRLYTFVRIHLPLMRSAAGAGLLVASIDLLKELPMTLALRPFDFDTLATRAFELAYQDRLPESALPAVAIVILGIIPAALLARQSRRREAKTEGADVSRAA